MKKVLSALIILMTLTFLIALFSQEFTYVGADKCKICHKSEKQGKQFPLWEESKHSKSFKVLTSEKVLLAAKESGMEIMPAENSECLKCHGPLFEKAAEFKEEGITCEICHGPGSAYKKLSIMKSREESVKNGLIVFDSTEAIKKQCLTCHENAHGKSFDFDSSWEKIKHSLPEQVKPEMENIKDSNHKNSGQKKSFAANQALIRDDEIFIRLNLAERIQHFILIVTFLILITTGLPLLFHEMKFLEWIFSFPKSFYIRGILHRIAAVTLILKNSP